MAIHTLVPPYSEILKKTIQSFDFLNPPTDPSQLAKDLAETMIANNGLGLSANQIGLPYRVFVITGSPIYACFNPRIVDRSSEEVLMEEGCLSYPNLFIKIKRPASIRVRFNMPNGEVKNEVFEGLTARVFQHELDHLDGIVHTQRASLFHLDQGKRKMKTISRRKKEKISA